MGARVRMAELVTRRPFGRSESWFYESAGAAAVADHLGPLFEARLPDGRVLDVGCGGGVLARRLARGDRQVVGVDPSRPQVARARSARRAVLEARAEQLPFPDDAFDGLYSSCSIKHWADRAAGLAECARVVRRGGPILIAETDGAATAGELRRFAGTTRLPRVLHPAYPAFARATLIAASPTLPELTAAVEHATDGPAVPVAVDGLPFTFVAGTAP